jgi:hypothetical protein
LERKKRLRADNGNFGLPSLVEFLEYLGFRQSDIKELMSNQSVIGDWFTGNKSVKNSKLLDDFKEVMKEIKWELTEEILPNNPDFRDEILSRIHQVDMIMCWPMTVLDDDFDELISDEPEELPSGEDGEDYSHTGDEGLSDVEMKARNKKISDRDKLKREYDTRIANGEDPEDLDALRDEVIAPPFSEKTDEDRIIVKDLDNAFGKDSGQ